MSTSQDSRENQVRSLVCRKNPYCLPASRLTSPRYGPHTPGTCVPCAAPAISLLTCLGLGAPKAEPQTRAWAARTALCKWPSGALREPRCDIKSTCYIMTVPQLTRTLVCHGRSGRAGHLFCGCPVPWPCLQIPCLLHLQPASLQRAQGCVPLRPV